MKSAVAHAGNARQMERIAAVGELYAERWGEFFHFALFDDQLESREAALERTHAKYCEALRSSRAARRRALRPCIAAGLHSYFAAQSLAWRS
jgi:hypothetical protein